MITLSVVPQGLLENTAVWVSNRQEQEHLIGGSSRGGRVQGERSRTGERKDGQIALT